MRGLLVRWLVSACALYLTSLIVPGIRVSGVAAALFAAAILGLLNAFVRPLVVLLTLPLTIVTLGLFILVVNGGMLWLASSVVRGFEVSGFGAALLGWLLLSLFTFGINLLIGDHGHVEVIRIREVREL